MLVVALPERARRLENDARNIDEVQVAIGRALSAVPPTQTVWTLDAGAVRYFGRPFVVDMAALNTPELLDFRAFPFVAAHPPAWVVAFETHTGPLPGARRFTSERYSVMANERSATQLLAACADVIASPVARRLLPPGTTCAR